MILLDISYGNVMLGEIEHEEFPEEEAVALLTVGDFEVVVMRCDDEAIANSDHPYDIILTSGPRAYVAVSDAYLQMVEDDATDETTGDVAVGILLGHLMTKAVRELVDKRSDAHDRS